MAHKEWKQYRLPSYNYASMGDYFITICTKDRWHHFGKITNNPSEIFIELTAIGLIAQESILAIPTIYKEVILGETVVMPNHLHLVMSLPFQNKNDQNKQAPLQQSMSPKNGLTPLIPGSVASIVNHLKGKVKKWCNANGHQQFQWQARFHDHIIRNSTSYNRINNYIANNIYNWHEDENNKDSNNFRKNMRA